MNGNNVDGGGEETGARGGMEKEKRTNCIGPKVDLKGMAEEKKKRRSRSNGDSQDRRRS
jgi:hypothetical protein